QPRSLNRQVRIENNCVVHKLTCLRKKFLRNGDTALSKEFLEYFVDDNRGQDKRVGSPQERREFLGFRTVAQVLDPAGGIDDVTLRSARSGHGLRFSSACP